jgi:hypothetical protein
MFIEETVAFGIVIGASIFSIGWGIVNTLLVPPLSLVVINPVYFIGARSVNE